MFLLWRGRRVDLTGRRITIGRRGRNDVVIRGDPFVSKSHCIITNGALRDTSKNGTRVNGSRVEQHSLRAGDCIRIGNAVLEVYGPQDASHEASFGQQDGSHFGPTGISTSAIQSSVVRNESDQKMTGKNNSMKRRMRRKIHEEQKVRCMLQLLSAFANSKSNSSRNCRTQDRYSGRRDEKTQIVQSDAGRKLQNRLLREVQRERRNRLSFYRRTLRHLRRTQRIRRRMEKSWADRFVADDKPKK
mmetsp:Transcript_9864/g.24296  ORF Transcript_9864/g.24296 Transcript_9864/m.24296 type:complete len:245 (-) Transcript_9864:252-986(-)